jgi:hypothetical protein
MHYLATIAASAFVAYPLAYNEVAFTMVGPFCILLSLSVLIGVRE